MKEFIKIFTVILAVAAILASLYSISISAAGALAPGRFSDTTVQYTAVTNTYGYSGVNYISGFDNANSANDYVLIRADCKGGARSDFLTSAFIGVRDLIGMQNWRFQTNSDELGTRYVELTFRENLTGITSNVQGYVEESSVNKTNQSDSWYQMYVQYWRVASIGWEND